MLTEQLATTDLATTPAHRLIYVVDDESMIGEVVEVILQIEGFDAQFFKDPVSAYEAFRKADPRPVLLFTDFVMTPMNGMELIERCRELEPSLKTILCSGNVSEEILQTYAKKPDGFLNKPFLPKKLVSLVESILSARNVAQG